MDGPEAEVAVGGQKGADDADSVPIVEVVEEGVLAELDGVQVLQEVAPVAILLGDGAAGDCVLGGDLSSHEVTKESSSGGG